MDFGDDLLICSHRGPTGQAQASSSRSAAAGGLLAVIGPITGADGVVWLCTPRTAAERALARGPQDGPIRFVDIDTETHRRFYDTACVTGLGFLFHDLFDQAYTPMFDAAFRAAWTAYIEVNQRYADAVMAAGPGGPILIEDYHLMAVAEWVRAADPHYGRPLVYFHHVPWCKPTTFRLLPAALRSQVLGWLLAFDTVGFHARAWVDAFLACCDEFLPDAQSTGDSVVWHGRQVPIVVAPAQIDVRQLRIATSAAPVADACAEIERWLAGRPLLVRVDRVDLWKNIPRGFAAFEEHARGHPDACFVAVLATSRIHLPPYRSYFDACVAAAQRINRTQGLDGTGPVRLVIDADRHLALAYLASATAVLANSTIDGLNIVPKEAVVVGKGRPRLVLSERTGVYEEIGRWVAGVDPFDIEQTAAAITTALHTPASTDQEALCAAVERNDPRHWLARRLAPLAENTRDVERPTRRVDNG